MAPSGNQPSDNQPAGNQPADNQPADNQPADDAGSDRSPTERRPVASEIVVRDAATVMLVRDSNDSPGIEVFMLRRNLNSDFVGGAYVFPGGGVEPQDLEADLEPYCFGRDDAEACRILGVGSGGLAYWVAAVRESFEEAGLLLARTRDGQVLRLDDRDQSDRFARHRASVDNGERRLIEICAEEDLVLDVAGMHYFSHWITPVGPPRRYDTRFFVAQAPAHQTAVHDDRETIENLWVSPQDALDRHAAGELEMILPTIRNLKAISRFDTAEGLLSHAAAVTDVPTILPKIVSDGGGFRIVLPGDPQYDELDSPGSIPPIPTSSLEPPPT